MKELQVEVPMVAMTHCEGAKVVQQFGEAADGFLCPTQWAETLSYSDKYFGSAAEYDKLFKETYDGYTTVPYQAAQASAAVIVRSEEHTSELQSLMRISYAVSCLKKNK